MAVRLHLRRPDERSLPGPASGLGGAVRLRAAADDGCGRGCPSGPSFLLVSLCGVRPLERLHDLLGLQCDGRRRHLRRPGQRPPDVRRMGAVPSGEEAFRRLPALCVPGPALDRVGALVFHLGADFLALAGPGQCLRPHHPLHPVVRIHGHPGRIAMDLGIQSLPLRPGQGPDGRIVSLHDVQGAGDAARRYGPGPGGPFRDFSQDLAPV